MTAIKRWVSVESEENTWLLDTEFLLSGYHCNWGSGCKGAFGDASMGCCGIGVVVEESEVDDLKERVSKLTANEWELHGTKKWLGRNRYGAKWHSRGVPNTAVVEHRGVTGCVFSNRTGFEGGNGCAFHIAAMNRGESPLDWKPTACWQVPLYISWSEDINAYVIRLMSEIDWADGDESVDVLEWWCADDKVSWGGHKPAYQTLSEEMERMIEDIEEGAWASVKRVLDQSWAEVEGDLPRATPVFITLIRRN